MNLFDDWGIWKVTVPCETCAPARGSIARFSIDLTVRGYGGYRGQHWQICGACLDSCLQAAFAQHRGPGIPVVNLMPTTVREYT